MVGGVVINIVRSKNSTWIQCEDAQQIRDKEGSVLNSYRNTCAIRVRDAQTMKIGDKLWWQDRKALWTPQPFDGRKDIVLEKVGYSHSNIPNDVIESLAPERK